MRLRGQGANGGGHVGLVDAALDLVVEGFAGLGDLIDDAHLDHGVLQRGAHLVGQFRHAFRSQQVVDAGAFQKVPVQAHVVPLEGVVDALGIQQDVAVGVVGEAGMLVLLAVGEQRNVHAFPSQFAEAHAPHALQNQR